MMKKFFLSILSVCIIAAAVAVLPGSADVTEIRYIDLGDGFAYELKGLLSYKDKDYLIDFGSCVFDRQYIWSDSIRFYEFVGGTISQNAASNFDAPFSINGGNQLYNRLLYYTDGRVVAYNSNTGGASHTFVVGDVLTHFSGDVLGGRFFGAVFNQIENSISELRFYVESLYGLEGVPENYQSDFLWSFEGVLFADTSTVGYGFDRFTAILPSDISARHPSDASELPSGVVPSPYSSTQSLNAWWLLDFDLQLDLGFSFYVSVPVSSFENIQDFSLSACRLRYVYDPGVINENQLSEIISLICDYDDPNFDAAGVAADLALQNFESADSDLRELESNLVDRLPFSGLSSVRSAFESSVLSMNHGFLEWKQCYDIVWNEFPVWQTFFKGSLIVSVLLIAIGLSSRIGRAFRD